MSFKAIPLDQILIAPNRQRKEFDAQAIQDLVDSFDRNGQLQPIVIRRVEGKPQLVAGERRLRAATDHYQLGGKLRVGPTELPPGTIAALDLAEMDPIDAFEAELEENIRRVDLTWQERAEATSQLFELRRLQAQKSGGPEPTIAQIASEAHPDVADSTAFQNTRTDVIVARHLNDPDVKKASTAKEALKVIKRKEENRKNAELGLAVGATFSSIDHQLLKGDCLEALSKFPPGSFDVILSDPPYGIDAQEFNDSGGKTPGAHFYDDSFESWKQLISFFLPHSERVSKAQAHLYLFCDIDNFSLLKSMVQEYTTFAPFRTPIIWHNPGAIRAPWPDKGPQRKYQCCLYAVKGGKTTLRLAPDLVQFPSDPNLGHPAQKPVALLQDLLNRSARPGDTVLDPFCGSGSIFPAAHALKIKATGIEMDESAYGLAVKRLGELK